MKIIGIPPLLTADGPSVAIQAAVVDGNVLHAVSLRDRGGRRRDRFFGDRSAALAHAVELADNLGLLLLDLAEPDE